MAVASMVLGIVALVFSCIIPAMGWLGAILGIIGIVLGVLGRKKQPEKKGMATAGMVMSIIAVALGIIFYIACAACAKAVTDAVGGADAWQDLANALESAMATGG